MDNGTIPSGTFDPNSDTPSGVDENDTQELNPQQDENARIWSAIDALEKRIKSLEERTTRI